MGGCSVAFDKLVAELLQLSSLALTPVHCDKLAIRNMSIGMYPCSLENI